DITKFNTMGKLWGVTARVINILKGKSFKYSLTEPTVENLNSAEKFWINLVQKELGNYWKLRYKRLGPTCDTEGIIHVGDRLSYWLKDNWNQTKFILLTPSHPFTKLYIQSIHCKDHAGIETTLAKLQSRFWVPRARKIIRMIKSKCIKCRKLAKKCEGQVMGPLPDGRLKPSPPFFRTSLDLFGPFFVKDTVK
ncbi:unnamed protein product, partial [Meganyctiphanes norvegica]